MQAIRSVVLVIVAALIGKLLADALLWGWIITLPLVCLWWAYEHHPFPRNCWQPALQWIVLSLWAPSTFFVMIIASLFAFLVTTLTERVTIPAHTRSTLALHLASSASVWHLTLILSSLFVARATYSLSLPLLSTLLADSLTEIAGSVALLVGLCELERFVQGHSWLTYRHLLYERTHRLA